MNNTLTKYSPEEILQIINDFYNCQSQCDPVVYPGAELTFNTTISEWRDICDLVEPRDLAKYYYDLFKLESPIEEFEKILIWEGKNKLADFCMYIAEHAQKEEIKPIISMGITCHEAAIFKTLISKLKQYNINTDEIKPSSDFVPLFKRYPDEFLIEVNKLAPGSLTNFDYKDNWIVRTGGIIILIFILSIIIVPMIWQFYWSLWIILGIGLTIVMIGKMFKPEKDIIGGYDTIRDLIIGMQEQLKKAAT
jgi:hypothetical protein